MKPTVTPSGAALGARIDNIDVSQPLTDEEHAFIERAFHENLVVCLSGKPYDDLALTRFGRRFGELEVSVAKSFHHKEYPQVTVLSNLVVDGKPRGSSDAGQMWHTDMSYNRIAGRATILHAHQVPMRDGKPLGDTAFGNMYLAYEALPADLQRQIDSLDAVHEFEKLWLTMIANGTAASRPTTSAPRPTPAPTRSWPAAPSSARRTTPRPSRRCAPSWRHESRGLTPFGARPRCLDPGAASTAVRLSAVRATERNVPC